MASSSRGGRDGVVVDLDEIRRRDQRAAAVERRLRAKAHSGVPVRFLGQGFDDYRLQAGEPQARAVKLLRRYSDGFSQVRGEGICLQLLGGVGTGKTMLVCALAQAVIDAGFSARYVTAMNAVREIRESYRRDSQTTEREAIKALTVPDLLVLDEVGQQYGTDGEQILLYDVINGRYEKQLPTVVVSNLDLKGVTGYLGERVIDRLREGGGRAVIFDWASYRRGPVA